MQQRLTGTIALLVLAAAGVSCDSSAAGDAPDAAFPGDTPPGAGPDADPGVGPDADPGAGPDAAPPTEERITLFRNNLDVVRVADPMILDDNGDYYLYATGQDTSDVGFQVWHSRDLVNWAYRGMAFEKSPTTWSQHDFWAPEVVKADGTYYLYYSAKDDVPLSSWKVCVATSSSPTGPFVEAAAPMFDDGSRGAIDGHVFVDTDGERYMFYSRQEWLVESFVESQIWVATMDSWTSTRSDYQFAENPSQDWEKISYLGALRWNEGPWVFEQDGTYYLMYSANVYLNSEYSVGYSTSSSPLGPWEKYPDNPILEPTSRASGPGHHSVVTTGDGQRWIAYHTHTGTGGADRQLNLDPLDLIDGVLSVRGPSSAPQPYPNGGYALAGTSDAFSAATLMPRWTVVSETPSSWRLEAGELVITSEPGDTFEENHEYRNVFLQHAPSGDFFVHVRVRMNTTASHEQAALYVWQDDDNYVRMSKGYLGLFGSQRFEAAQEHDGSYSSTFAPNPTGETAEIGIKKVGNEYSCWYRDGGDWIQVGPTMQLQPGPLKLGVAALSPGSGNAVEAFFDDFVIQRD